PRDAGCMRQCASEPCRAQHFPRTDPVVIMMVIRGDRCLVGRQPAFPPGVFSALAGFVEPGETVEEAVRREVLEEAGIEVGEVRYHSTQPWPFPSSLMIGCFARALTEAIRICPTELEEARWVARDDLRAVLQGARDRGLRAPGHFAIAHQLMKAWVEGQEP
ncbi:MAG: NAD(+) diphosphatase, partial [Proteobacteria bacterium]|nr:NAD(+) diphosphatase [Pseudomonadota bacterium]